MVGVGGRGVLGNTKSGGGLQPNGEWGEELLRRRVAIVVFIVNRSVRLGTDPLTGPRSSLILIILVFIAIFPKYGN